MRGLLVALRHTENAVHWQVVDALTVEIKEEDKSVLLRALAEDTYLVKALIADILGQRPDLDSYDKLLPLLNDSAPFARGLAIRAIGRLKCKQAIETLKLAIQKSDRGNSGVRTFMLSRQ